MDDSFEKWLETALAHYERVIFLYRLSLESYARLCEILEREKREILLLTDTEVPDFPCNQWRLCEEECERLLEMYFSYSFTDRFVFLTDCKNFPWPSINNFAEADLAAKREIFGALLE